MGTPIFTGDVFQWARFYNVVALDGVVLIRKTAKRLLALRFILFIFCAKYVFSSCTIHMA